MCPPLFTVTINQKQSKYSSMNYVFHRMLPSNKEEQTTDTHNLDESQRPLC